MRLPNGHRAEIGDKLEEYCLNADHPRGKNKARVFKSALGLTVANSYLLREALLVAAAHSAEVQVTGDKGYGMTYQMIFPMATAAGSAKVMTGWIVETGTDFPRLTTCYIL